MPIGREDNPAAGGPLDELLIRERVKRALERLGGGAASAVGGLAPDLGTAEAEQLRRQAENTTQRVLEQRRATMGERRTDLVRDDDTDAVMPGQAARDVIRPGSQPPMIIENPKETRTTADEAVYRRLGFRPVPVQGGVTWVRPVPAVDPGVESDAAGTQRFAAQRDAAVGRVLDMNEELQPFPVDTAIQLYRNEMHRARVLRAVERELQKDSRTRAKEAGTKLELDSPKPEDILSI